MQFHRKLIDEGPWIEFLIPLTIVAAAFKNVVSSPARSRWTAPLLAGGFGVIHGAGFANSLQGLFGDQVLVPLFGFDLGIEAGQLVVVATLLSVFSLADQLRTAPSTGRGVRMRDGVEPCGNWRPDTGHSQVAIARAVTTTTIYRTAASGAPSPERHLDTGGVVERVN